MTEPTVAVLRSVPLLAAATTAELEVLTATAYRKRLARGQVLFSEGEPSRDLYVVVRGRVKVVVTSPRGGELVLDVLEPGDVLGELSLLDEQPRSTGAEAVEDAELLAVPTDAVRAVFAGSPALTTALALELAGTVRRLTGAASDLVFLDLRRRLAKLLLDLVGAAGVGDLGMPQADVAARLGATRQSVNRALAALAQRGWIDVDGASVRVLDRASLERFAGS